MPITPFGSATPTIDPTLQLKMTSYDRTKPGDGILLSLYDSNGNSISQGNLAHIRLVEGKVVIEPCSGVNPLYARVLGSTRQVTIVNPDGRSLFQQSPC